MTALAACQTVPLPSETTDFVVYYGQRNEHSALTDRDVVVLDSQYDQQHKPLPGQVYNLGYLSLGESDNASLQAAGLESLIVTSNHQWNSVVVDIRDPRWKNYLLHTRIPAILAKGFDGLMLDTVDSVTHLEVTDAQRYSGMQASALDVIASIRKQFPEIKLMLNRGYALYPEVAPHLDMALAESILVHQDMKTSKPSLHPNEDYRHYLAKIAQLKQANPRISFFSLDYWDMNDVNGVKTIYRTQRQHGLIPYVSTPDLQQPYSADGNQVNAFRILARG